MAKIKFGRVLQYVLTISSFFFLSIGTAYSEVGDLPILLQNDTTADADEVMANFNFLRSAIVTNESNISVVSTDYVSSTNQQSITGRKAFNSGIDVLSHFSVGSSEDWVGFDLYGNMELKNASGSSVFELKYNDNNDVVFSVKQTGAVIRTNSDIYLKYSDTSSWRDLYSGEIYLYDYLKLHNGTTETQTGQIYGNGSNIIVVKPTSGGYSVLHNSAYIGSSISKSPSPYELYVAGDAYFEGGYSSSDIRLKMNIKTLENPLGKIMRIRGIRFNWIDREEDGEQIGFVAQEVEKIYPELIQTGSDGYKAVDYSKFTPILLEANKQLQKKNKVLEESVADLEDRIAKLEEMLGL